MLKLTLAVLAVALAGTASAGGWRALRVDGTSEAAFAKSVEAFREKLSPGRRYAFERALQDIFSRGPKGDEAEREYTAIEYFRELDGLGYKEIVTLTDPTGETARRHRAAYNPYLNRAARGARPGAAPAAMRAARDRPPPIGWNGEHVRGTDQSSPAYIHAQKGCISC